MVTRFSPVTTGVVLAALCLFLTLPASLAQDSGSSSPGTFDQVLLIDSDDTLPSPDIAHVAVPDPTFSFFRDIMGYSETELQQCRADAEAFFRSRFGIDFGAIVADASTTKTIPGVGFMMPWRMGSEVNYRAIYKSGSGGPKEAPEVRDGGLLVVITENGYHYRGAYGGEAGIPAAPGDMLLFGYYNIAGLGAGNEPLIIHYVSDAPMRGTVDGDGTIKCALEHAVWGRGIAQGLSSLYPTTNGRGHIGIRNALTFPARLPDR